MAESTRRCGKCGLAQFSQAECRRCGASLAQPGVQPRARVLPLHPLLAIWTRPRQAIRTITARDLTWGVPVIPWLVGIGVFLSAIAPRTDDRFPLVFAVPMAVMVGPLLSFTLVFAAAMLTTWTGGLLGGRGTAVELRAAVVWSQIPLLLYLLLWIPLASVEGPWKVAADLTEIIVLLWSECLAVVLIAEVHGFSLGRSVAAVLLAWVVKVVLLVGTVATLMWLFPTKT